MELHLNPWTRLRVAAVLIGGAVLAGCGSMPASSPTPTSFDTADVRASAVTSYEQWAGSATARQAAEVVVAYRLNGAWSACMREHGLPSRWETAIAGVEPIDPLTGSLWLMRPHARPYSERALAMTWSARAQAVLTSHLSESARQTAVACHAAVHEAGDDAVDAIREPVGVRSLREKWNDALAPIAERFGGEEAYLKCLDQQDIPALEGEGWRAIDSTYTRALPQPLDIPLADEEASPQWQHFLQLEQPLVDADWACRSAHYDEALALLQPIVADFEASHGAEIDALIQHWQNVEREAAALGWSPESPQAALTP